jgi:hypothetical protein
MRVYIGSGLREDKNHTSYVHRLYYDLYLPYLQDSIYNYLLNCLGYGPPGPCPLPKCANSWQAPLFLSTESRRCGIHGTKPHQAATEDD